MSEQPDDPHAFPSTQGDDSSDSEGIAGIRVDHEIDSTVVKERGGGERGETKDPRDDSRYPRRLASSG